MTVAASFLPPIFEDEYDGEKMRSLVAELERLHAEVIRGFDTIDTTGNEVNDLSVIVTWANVPDANITQGSVTQHEAAINHDALTNFLSAEHVDWAGASAGTIDITNFAALQNVVEDTTPQLGADLEGQGFNLQELGVIFMKEQAEADADVPGEGQLWVNTATPNELWFTPDGGVDKHLVAKNIDETITGSFDFTTGVAGGANPPTAGLTMTSNNPGFLLEESDAPTDAKVWTFEATGGKLQIRARKSDGSLSSIAWEIARTAEVVDDFTSVAPFHAEEFIKIRERAAAGSSTLAYGQLWCLNTIPSELWYTTDAGDDIQLTTGTAHAGTEVNDLSVIVTWANIPEANVPTHTGDVEGGTDLSLVVAAITSQTALTSGLASTDELLLSDGGVIKRMDISVIEAYMLANLAFNNYVHDTHPGDDFSVDSTLLAGATVISDIDINVTTDAEGHVTDANGAIATRELTAANIGATTEAFVDAHVWNANDITAGTLLVARGGTGVTTKTGTGNVVLSSSPTLVTPIAARRVATAISDYDKLRVYSSSSYTIGMVSAITYGGLGDWAMTFKFNDDADRGFWWGDDGHSKAQGAMALTTGGKLTVAHSIRVGYGESDATDPGATWMLDVNGPIRCNGADTKPAALNSALSANMLHIDGKECIDGNDAWVRINQNGDFTSGTYTPGYFLFGGNIRVVGSIDLDGNINGDGASIIDGIETIKIDATGDITKVSHGNYLYHKSTAYDNDQNGEITLSTSAASGGTTGDIWFKYTA